MTDARHSKYSPSAADRWTVCTGSIPLASQYEDDSGGDDSSIYADEGTKAHDVLAEIAAAKYWNTYLNDSPYSEKPVIDALEYDIEMYGHCANSLKIIDRYVDVSSSVYIEQRVKMSSISDDCFGTADFVIEKPHEIHVIDFKYGAGIRVDAHHNKQLLLYAIGVRDTYGIDEDVNYVLHIIQPRVENSHSTWEITGTALGVFANWVENRIYEVEKHPILKPGDNQCRWCPAMRHCPAVLQLTNQTLEYSMDNDIEVTDDIRSELLAHEGIITKYLESLRGEFSQRILSGESIDGWKMVEGRSYQKWSADAEEKLKEEFGDSIYNKRIMSITDAKKKLGINVDDYTVKPPGTPTLVEDSDRRPAITDDSQFTNLND